MSTIAVIGAGIGGLTVSALLAKKGHRVVLFESHSAPGGYTAGFWRKGYYFESGTLSFENIQLIRKVMHDLGAGDTLEFKRQRLRWVSTRFDFIVDSADCMREQLISAYPEQRAGLLRFFAKVKDLCGCLETFNPPRSVVGAAVYPLRMTRAIAVLNKCDRMTLPEFIALYIDKNTELFRVLEHLGYPNMSAAIIPGVFLMMYQDYWTVYTGMQSWADLIAKKFAEYGGELRLNSKVDAILTRDGAAVGVMSKGNEFKADYVISASDYKKTFLQLLDDRSIMPQDFFDRVDKAPTSEAFFTVYCGLDISREIMERYLQIPHVLYFDNHPACKLQSDDEGYFARTSVGFYSPSLMNPDLAPQGKSSLMIQCMCPRRWMNNWGGGDRQTYQRLKDVAKRALIDHAARLIPDIKQHIEFEDAATPLTYERYTHNTDGASSAWSWDPRERFYRHVQTIHIKSPVKNLYISSCWSAQIGGIPSALLAARRCAKKISTS
jgi:phytoene dehydrogenase-like protein